MNEVYPQCIEAIDLDLGLEIGKFVDFFFLIPPVEVVFPIGSQPLDIFKWSSVVPSSSVKLIWEFGQFKLCSQLPESLVWYSDGVGCEWRHDLDDRVLICRG